VGRAVTPASEERFAALARQYRRRAGVTTGRMFGSEGLKVGGKTFAMLVKERLVVKLPGSRVEQLIGDGVGDRFDPGHGRLMKEWLAVRPDAAVDWRVLADEALAFVERRG
jgi:TfoX/Sxy family transcriptional regulator of competence genes